MNDKLNIKITREESNAGKRLQLESAAYVGDAMRITANARVWPSGGRCECGATLTLRVTANKEEIARHTYLLPVMIAPISAEGVLVTLLRKAEHRASDDIVAAPAIGSEQTRDAIILKAAIGNWLTQLGF